MRDEWRGARLLDDARPSAVEAPRRAHDFVRRADWLRERFPDARLCDVEGLVTLVKHGEVMSHVWSSMLGGCVGVAPEEGDEDLDFEEALRTIHIDLKGLNEEPKAPAKSIARNFEELEA